MSVLTATNLAMHYGAQDVFSGISVAIARGDRIALVGPNGSGKTTLLRILAGFETPSEGTVQKVRSLRIGYLPQQAEFSGDVTLYEEMLGVFADLRAQQEELRRLEAAMADPERRDEALARYGELQVRFELAGGYAYEDRIRQVLSHLGFREADLDLPLTLLSGGQRTRALLAKLILSQPDLLLLDEPTNHLDLEACDALLAALDAFSGAVVLVTHNEMFLHALAERLIVFRGSGIELFEGTYAEFLEKGGWQDEKSPPAPTPSAARTAAEPPRAARRDLKRRRAEIAARRTRALRPLEEEMRRLEGDIERLDAELAALTRAMQEASREGDGGRIAAVAQAMHARRQESDRLFDALDRATREHERLAGGFERELQELESGDVH